MSSEEERAFGAREADCSRGLLKLAKVYTILMYHMNIYF